MAWTRRDVLRRPTIGAALTPPLAQTLAVPHVARAQGDRHGGTLRISATFGLSTINPVAHISGAEWLPTRRLYSKLTRLSVKRGGVPDPPGAWAAPAGGGARAVQLWRGG